MKVTVTLSFPANIRREVEGIQTLPGLVLVRTTNALGQTERSWSFVHVATGERALEVATKKEAEAVLPFLEPVDWTLPTGKQLLATPALRDLVLTLRRYVRLFKGLSLAHPTELAELQRLLAAAKGGR
jgi:hypothetical protein